MSGLFVCAALIAAAMQRRRIDSDTHRSSSASLVIGTRTSNLAMTQASEVSSLLSSIVGVRIVGIQTDGDSDQSTPLNQFKSKGIFTKQLDIALLDHRIDAAVHCCKDLPTSLPDGIVVGAFVRRDSNRCSDAVVFSKKFTSNQTLAHMPDKSRIGTSAIRRQSAIRRRYPKVDCVNIRGNVQTRLRKLDEGEYDAIVLAEIGLRRLNLENRIGEILPVETFGYAVGQGALAVLVRDGDSLTLETVRNINDTRTQVECEAERALLKCLNGGCRVPISCRSRADIVVPGVKVLLSLWAAVSSPDGSELVEDEIRNAEILLSKLDGQEEKEIPKQTPADIGWSVGERLLKLGADNILAKCPH